MGTNIGILEECANESSVGRLAELPIASIQPDANQPRKSVGEDREFENLKESILQHGILQPIIVSPLGERHFRIISGERRYQAAKQIGLKTVPSLIRSVQDQERLELQIIENIHRAELNALDEARSVARLRDEFGLKLKDLAKKLGKSISSVSQTLKILELPEEILSKVQTSEKATKSVLLEIAKIADAKHQLEMWRKLEKEGLTVNEARNKIYAKRSTSQRIKLGTATVTIRFRKGTYGKEDIRKVLRDALELV